MGKKKKKNYGRSMKNLEEKEKGMGAPGKKFKEKGRNNK